MFRFLLDKSFFQIHKKQTCCLKITNLFESTYIFFVQETDFMSKIHYKLNTNILISGK